MEHAVRHESHHDTAKMKMAQNSTRWWPSNEVRCAKQPHRHERFCIATPLVGDDKNAARWLCDSFGKRVGFPCIILSNWNVIFHIPLRLGWCLAVLGKVSFLRQDTNEPRRIHSFQFHVAWLFCGPFVLSLYLLCIQLRYIWNVAEKRKKNNKTLLTTEETSLDTLTVLPATFWFPSKLELRLAA